MKINLNELRGMGFDVEYDDRNDEITVHPNGEHRFVDFSNVHEQSRMAGLTPREADGIVDELVTSIMRVQISRAFH